MSLFDYYPDIPKPGKPLLGTRREARLAPSDLSKTEQFSLMQKRVNYLAEMMKFMPDAERAGYAGLSEDDEDVKNEWDSYGEIARTSEEESTVGHYGNVVRDLQADGNPYGYGALQSYEEIDLLSEAGDFNHIDAEKGGFKSTLLFDAEKSSMSNISAGLWEETKAFLKGQNKSYYEIAMEHGGNLSDLSDKDAFLLMVGMLESRTRVWLTMEELFGKFDETDDQKRIAIIDGWVAAAENELNPENISLLSVFLDTQESFTNRLAGFYGDTSAYMSLEDTERTSAFFEALQAKVMSYADSLGATDAGDEVRELWDEWVAPAEDPDAYPSYAGYDWSTTPGNILMQEDGTESEQVVDQTKGLLASEYKGLRKVSKSIKGPDGTVFQGNPYDQIWGTHIRGVFQRLIDTYIGENLSISISNRRKNLEFQEKQEEYDQKIWDERQTEKYQEKMKAQRKAETEKAEMKQKASTKKADQEQRAAITQALAKKKIEKQSQERSLQQKMKVSGKASAQQTSKRLTQGFKATKTQLSNNSKQSLERNKKAFQKVFGDAQKRVQSSSKQNAKKFSVAQSQKSTQRRSTQSAQYNQTLAKMVQQNKKRGR